MKTTLFFALILLSTFACPTMAQFAISDTSSSTPPPLHPSAVLHITSVDKGVLIPRISLSQRASIATPATGLLIYNSDDSCFDYFNGLVWLPLKGTLSTTTVPIVRTYTTNTTWTKPPGLKYIIVEMVGGGGGGGGCGYYAGGAGAGAGYCKKIIASNLLQNSEIILIGSGGIGGSVSSTGGDGGTTSFGSHCSATGGQGGKGQVNDINFSIGSFPGIGIGGDFNTSGQGSGGAVGGEAPHCGGSSFFGGGAPSNEKWTSADGINATGYGSGASGGIGYFTENRIGGNGSGGIVIITEYY